MVTLPDGVDACDIGTITVWCQPFRAIFTRLEIPRKTFVSIVENGRIPLASIYDLIVSLQLNNGADPCAVAVS